MFHLKFISTMTFWSDKDQGEWIGRRHCTQLIVDFVMGTVKSIRVLPNSNLCQNSTSTSNYNSTVHIRFSFDSCFQKEKRKKPPPCMRGITNCTEYSRPNNDYYVCT